MEQTTSYRTYWGIWVVLLVLTLFMITIEGVEMSRALTVLVLAGAMMVKATLIAGWFMHLRYEHIGLMLSVVLGTLGTAAFLYFLLIPDSLAVLESVPR